MPHQSFLSRLSFLSMLNCICFLLPVGILHAATPRERFGAESHLTLPLHGDLHGNTSSSLAQIDSIKAELKAAEQLSSLSSDVHRVAPSAAAVTASSGSDLAHSRDTLALERRLSNPESRLTFDSKSSLDSSSLGMLLPTRYPGSLSSDLHYGESRYGESRFSSDPRQSLLPASSNLSYTASNTNMAILEQSRSLTTLPLPTTPSAYPLISSNMLGSITHPSSSIAPSSYLPSSPTVLSSGLLYSSLYPTGSGSQYQPNLYIHTTEGQTLELLGGGSGSNPRSRLSMTPPALPSTTTTGQAELDELKPKVHAGADVTSHNALSLPASHHSTHHDSSDPSSVWRPY